MNSWPIEDLEHQAAAERRELHERATELRTKVQGMRQNLDVTQNARRHFGPAAAVLAIVGLVSGYALAGLFTRH